jgi:ribonuclease HI
MSDLVAYVDGGSLGNPGPSGIGVVIDGSTDGTIRIAKWIGHQDNNVAEYVALLEALQCALGLKAKTLHVFSDSEVMVKQMSGEYNCRSPLGSHIFPELDLPEVGPVASIFRSPTFGGREPVCRNTEANDLIWPSSALLRRRRELR